jgi:hypothetical protein
MKARIATSYLRVIRRGRRAILRRGTRQEDAVKKSGLWASLLASALALLLVSGTLAATTDPFTPGSSGTDVSWPNCSATLPTSTQFAIVGVTGGRAFTSNACFAAEWTWATSNAGVQSLYMNLNAPVGSTSSYATLGPKVCKHNDKICLSYDYGWQAAKSAFEQAQAAGASAGTWWLDVETSNSWTSSTAANAQVIQGAVDYLGAGTTAVSGQGLAVGVYSTNAMYARIAGSYHPANGQATVPTWYATVATSSAGAASYCTSKYAFTGGPVWLVQYASGGLDADYAC